MESLQVKKVLLEEALVKKSMENMFTVVEKDNLVLFRSFQDIYANNCLTAIILSESAYTMINIFFGKLALEEKRAEVLALINKLNTTYSANKFILSDNDTNYGINISKEENVQEYLNYIEMLKNI